MLTPTRYLSFAPEGAGALAASEEAGAAAGEELSAGTGAAAEPLALLAGAEDCPQAARDSIKTIASNIASAFFIVFLSIFV